MNSKCQLQFDIALSSVPKVLYQTNTEDHEKLQQLIRAALPSDFERKFYNDQMCEEYIKEKLGPRGMEHYKELAMGSHRAHLFSDMCYYFLRVEHTWTSNPAS